MNDLLNELNEAQRVAVESAKGPVMIIAGAGSGKTRVITYRTAYLIHSVGASPHQILALTFTNRAATEMRERIETLLGNGSTDGLWIGTFHANFARLLRQHISALGFTSNFSIYDAEDSQRVMKDIMTELGLNAQTLSPNTVQSKISAAKNKFILPAEFEQTARDYVDEKIAHIYRRYAERLRKNNALDFDDLLIKPIELFLQRPDILEFYQSRFAYLMIDEYQDTNRAQYLVSKMLAAKHRNICVVGDDAQSIYSWRGADISNILGFQQDYPDAVTVRLEENYRSTKVILKAANSIIKRNREQLEKKLFTQNETGEPITLMVADDERREADKISFAIRNLKLTKGFSNRDFAIFYRTNAQSRALEDALRANAIPYKIFGNISFYKRKEIKDVVAYLRFALNEQDEESLLRIINVPTRGIGETSLDKLRQLAASEGVSIYDVMKRAAMYPDVPARLISPLGEFRMLIESMQETAKKYSAYQVVAELYEKTRLLELLKQENTSEANARYDNLQEFLSLAKSFSDQNEGDDSLKTFLENVALVNETEDKDESDNKVSLMTIHSAKGLEFPVVFVSGLEEKLFPLNPDDAKDLEEERRLFYVAVTRARQKLHITYAKSRYRFGNLQPTLKSRFIDELDGDVVQTESGQFLRDLRAAEKEKKRIVRDDYSQETYEDFSDFSDNWKRPERKSASPKPSTSPTSPALSIGMKVQHKIFGSGKVIALQGAGDDAKVRVFFKTAGEKTLVVKYANLTPYN